MTLSAAHKQGFSRWPWPWPFIWSSWTMVLTPDMPILHCMSSRWGIYPGEAFHSLFQALPSPPLLFIAFFTLHRPPLSERLEQARLSIDRFSFERVAQSNLEWLFSKMDSGFQSSVGFRIPKPRIPDSTNKIFLDSLTWGELCLIVKAQQYFVTRVLRNSFNPAPLVQTNQEDCIFRCNNTI